MLMMSIYYMSVLVILALGCFIFATLVHLDLNNRPVFDTVWTTALYIDVVTMVGPLRSYDRYLISPGSPHDVWCSLPTIARH